MRNAAALTDPVEVPEKPRRFLTTAEAQAVLKAAQGERLEALYVLDLNVGPRIGEALALRWQDIDLDGAHVSIVYNLQRVQGKLVLVEPKTEKSRRTVGLPPAAVEALRAHRRQQTEERLRLGPIWQNSQLAFTSQVGSPLDPSDVSRAFRSFLESHELPSCQVPRPAPRVRLNHAEEWRPDGDRLGHPRTLQHRNDGGHLRPRGASRV